MSPARDDTSAVSVVVPTYKRPQLLRRAIASVVEQTRSDWELVVSDDEPSPGETWALLTKLAAADRRIRPIRNPGPHGQVGNMNYAMLTARGPWLKPLYDDDVLKPDCLDVFLRAAGAHPEAALLCCLAEYHLGESTSLPPIGRRKPLELIPQDRVHLAMYLQDVDVGTPTQVMIRRDFIARGALMREHPQLVSGVDSWWFARILEHGHLLIVNRVLVEQHQGAHSTVTSGMTDEAMDREFIVLRELMEPQLRGVHAAPPLHTVSQMLKLIRAAHRLQRRRPGEAVSLALQARSPRAWLLAGRWLLRRSFPGRFESVLRVAVKMPTCAAAELRPPVR